MLDLLCDQPGLYGLQLVEASSGALKRGTVYVTLGRMEDKGYVLSRVDEDAPEHGGLPAAGTSRRHSAVACKAR